MYKIKCIFHNLAKLFICLASPLYLSSPANAGEHVTIVNLPFADHHLATSPPYFYEEVLKLALQKTELKYGKFQIVFYPFPAGRERQRAMVKNSLGIDVLWSTSNPTREEQLLAVKFNLLREFSDYKILMIRHEDQATFSRVKSLAELRNLKAGTGTHWRDTQVLLNNDMPFVTSWDYEPLFKMLAAKRFDYIVRGAQEIWNELALHPDLGLVAEQHLLLRYHQPVYFFVRPDNTKLATRILEGLELAQKDGSMEALIISIPGFLKAREEIRSKERKIIDMTTQ